MMMSGSSPDTVKAVFCTSRAVHDLPGLAAMLEARVIRAPLGAAPDTTAITGSAAVVAWGRKPSAARATRKATRWGLKVLRLEDGFLRSYGTGDRFPGLSLVVDDEGIYYDSTRPSALETLLNSPQDLLCDQAQEVSRARQLLLTHQLSKYNHAPALPPETLCEGDTKRVLVVDQTYGDLSVQYGGASDATFQNMLAAALAENPGATIYVKTHPEATAGRKRGYLTGVHDSALPGGQRIVVLRSLMNPIELVGLMDRVYVVSSTMGFEALLAGKPVTCFGLPWYAGWGATDDRQTSPRRTRKRLVDELFAAAYFHYSRYLSPETHTRGTVFDVIDWLVRQRQMAGLARKDPGGRSALPFERNNEAIVPVELPPHEATGRLMVVGFPQWRRYNLGPMLSLLPGKVHFTASARTAERLLPQPGDRLLYWGGDAPAGLETLAKSTGASLLRMEDGFVRGVGLGSDLLRPWSLVVDSRGIYFNPSNESDLERLLATAEFLPRELNRAALVRAFIVKHAITKYNIEPRLLPDWPSTGRPVVFVPGQVEDDASIRHGCLDVRTNMGLLQAARRARPGAFIVYKPHPDVISRNRIGRVDLEQALRWADHVELSVSVVSCIDACDEVHTMTSLAGFDALLRGKQVFTYGQPFYAGWGLTQDVLANGHALARRRRRLTLDELVAGTLLRYPLYWDWILRGFTTCEGVLARVLADREEMESGARPDHLRSGWVRRQVRKLAVVCTACLARA